MAWELGSVGDSLKHQSVFPEATNSPGSKNYKNKGLKHKKYGEVEWLSLNPVSSRPFPKQWVPWDDISNNAKEIFHLGLPIENAIPSKVVEARKPGKCQETAYLISWESKHPVTGESFDDSWMKLRSINKLRHKKVWKDVLEEFEAQNNASVEVDDLHLSDLESQPDDRVIGRKSQLHKKIDERMQKMQRLQNVSSDQERRLQGLEKVMQSWYQDTNKKRLKFEDAINKFQAAQQVLTSGITAIVSHLQNIVDEIHQDEDQAKMIIDSISGLKQGLEDIFDCVE